MCHPQTKPLAPPAWAMMPPSNSLQLLDETFSVSGTELSATKQHRERFRNTSGRNAFDDSDNFTHHPSHLAL
ncbi:Rz1 family lipoprotein [Escherichia coli]|uniref:Rz1 family lipoprotein n=1 Tax=Escherichia coli TaxID=562 RepID=UPI001F3F829D|nr:Rz1 family lipoprotein [Escherichia coli]MEC9609693.1 Rz1 family lipoprotein [Escherichia coli]MEC9654449.1 Rz1 family lipoprotein [Escherichia coli]MED0522157.1 Rz1 family lipoprotein [Escherichia coli]MED8879135.1 Rz1 family lipoprotein [Escherichia coli]MED8933100.1 Rz1 family lipoprotein [Escherichia coli]